MIKFGKILCGLAVLASLALALSYCGSKSSDSGTTTGTTTGTASAGAGASASSGAIKSASMSLSAMAGTTSAPSLKRAKNLSDAVNGFYSGLTAKRAEVSALKAQSLASAAPMACANGGTQTTTSVTSGTTITGTTTTMTVIYANCKINSGSGASIISEVQNGTVVYASSPLSFSYKLGDSTTPYSMTSTLLATNTVLQSTSATMTYTGVADTNSVLCSHLSQYNKYTITMDGNMQLKGFDDTGASYDEAYVATAYQLVANSTLDSLCSATSGTVSESGALAYTDNLDSKASESLDIPGATPLTLTWTAGTTGDTYKISGTCSMATQCFTGSLTLATTTDMFIPNNKDCPTAGVVAVSGSVSGAVVYTSTGGVQIKDSTGAVVETYTSCNDAQACI